MKIDFDNCDFLGYANNEFKDYIVAWDGLYHVVDKEGNIKYSASTLENLQREPDIPRYVDTGARYAADFTSCYCHIEEEELEPQVQAFKEVLDNMFQTYLAKNHDYGNSVEHTYELFGDISFLTRINDKINRLNTLCTKSEMKVKDESINDTILDLANYAVLFYITRNKK